MIDVIEAVELFEICANEMAKEDSSGYRRAAGVGRRRLSLTARALAKRQLNVAHLARCRPTGSLPDKSGTDEPTMTLGAMIVFCTGYRFDRAGASTGRTLDAIYHAVQRYVEIIPISLQDGLDQAAVGALLADARRSSRVGRCRLGAGMRGATCADGPSPAGLSVAE
jgi:hypothetical protein